MREPGSFEFGALVAGTPTFLAKWRLMTETSVWDRHYIVGNGHGMRINSGTQLLITRRNFGSGFRVEEDVIEATFPLDWMVAVAVRRVLPKPLRQAALAARGSAQAFVDALAEERLPQASVHKLSRTYRKGGILATMCHLHVPDWDANAIHLNLKVVDPKVLTELLVENDLEAHQDVAIEDWLCLAYQRAVVSAATAATMPLVAASNKAAERPAPAAPVKPRNVPKSAAGPIPVPEAPTPTAVAA